MTADTSALTRTRLTPVFRVKPLLRTLGLPTAARWPEVSKAVKKRIVEARLAGDDNTAALWSEAKAFLSRNVIGTCAQCGCAVSKQRVRCCIACRDPNSSKASSQMIVLHGEAKSLADWCRVLGRHMTTVQTRLARGIAPEEALLSKRIVGREKKHKVPVLTSRLQ